MAQLEPTTCKVFIYGHLDEFDKEELDRFNSITYTINGSGVYTNGQPVDLEIGEYVVHFNNIENAKTPEDIIFTITETEIDQQVWYVGKYETNGYCYFNATHNTNDRYEYNMLMQEEPFNIDPRTCLLFKHLNIIDIFANYDDEILYMVTDYCLYKYDPYANNGLPQLLYTFVNKVKELSSSRNNPYCIDSSSKFKGFFILLENGEVYYYSILNATDYLGIGESLIAETMYKLAFFNTTDKKAKHISLSLWHCAVVLEDGTVYTTGSNGNGSLGLGDTVDKYQFTNVASLTNVKNVYCTNARTIFLLEDGTVYGSGYAPFGSMPTNDMMFLDDFYAKKYPLPTRVMYDADYNLLPPIKDVFGTDLFFYMDYNNKLYVCGWSTTHFYPLYKYTSNDYNDSLTEFTYITKDPIPNGVHNFETTNFYGPVIISGDKTSLYWRGLNDQEMFESGNILPQMYYKKFNYDWGSTIQKVEVYDFAPSVGFFVYLDNGDVYDCYNEYDTGNFPIIKKLPVSNVKQMYEHKHILLENNDLYDFSDDYDYTITKIFSNVEKYHLPRYGGEYVLLNTGELYKNSILLTTDVYNFFENSRQVFIQKNNYEIYSMGSNAYGQLGVGDTTTKSVPTLVVGTFTSYIKEILIESYNTFILFENGDIYTTGRNTYGQLGNGNFVNSNIFTKLDLEIIDAKNLFIYENRYSYEQFLYMITNSNDVYVWGYNFNYQLGLGHNEHVSTPQKVFTNVDIKEIQQNYLLTTQGVLYEWGVSTSFTSTTEVFNNVNIKKIIYNTKYYKLLLLENGDIYYWGLYDSVNDITISKYFGNPFITTNIDYPVKWDNNFMEEPPTDIINLDYYDFSIFILSNNTLYALGQNDMYNKPLGLSEFKYYNDMSEECLHPVKLPYSIQKTQTQMWGGYLGILTTDNHILVNECIDYIYNLNKWIYFPVYSPVNDFFANKSPIKFVVTRGQDQSGTFYILENGDIYVAGYLNTCRGFYYYYYKFVEPMYITSIDVENVKAVHITGYYEGSLFFLMNDGTIKFLGDADPYGRCGFLINPYYIAQGYYNNAWFTPNIANKHVPNSFLTKDFVNNIKKHETISTNYNTATSIVTEDNTLYIMCYSNDFFGLGPVWKDYASMLSKHPLFEEGSVRDVSMFITETNYWGMYILTTDSLFITDDTFLYYELYEIMDFNDIEIDSIYGNKQGFLYIKDSDGIYHAYDIMAQGKVNSNHSMLTIANTYHFDSIYTMYNDNTSKFDLYCAYINNVLYIWSKEDIEPTQITFESNIKKIDSNYTANNTAILLVNGVVYANPHNTVELPL